MALLGVAAAPAWAQSADADGVSLQYGRYHEGERDLLGRDSRFDPITVDSLQMGATFMPSDRWRFRLGYAQDTWSGATPISTAPAPAGTNSDAITGATPYINTTANLFLDQATLTPLELDENLQLTGQLDPRLVHTLSGASPETRRQLDFTLTSEFTDAVYSFGGGASLEPDYDAYFANIGARWDFNRNLTTLSAGLSYTSSDIDARIDHDASPYIYDDCGFLCDSPSGSAHFVRANDFAGNRSLVGEREDWAGRVGVTQIINRGALLEAGLSFTNSTGYLANPYKVVEALFIDPDQQFLAPEGAYYVTMAALMERRPDERNQGALDLRYVQHIGATDAALHLDYRYFQDDWGISAHTFAAEWAQPLGHGWRLTPRVRYYSQSAADFYTPYLVTFQSEHPPIIDPVRGRVYLNGNTPDDGEIYFDDPSVADPQGVNPNTGNPVVDRDGNPVSQEIADMLFGATTNLDRSLLPAHYSSDHRLSAYGALSYGLTLSRELAEGVSLDLSFEHYTHAGSLRLGGGGEGDYSDFDYNLFSAALKVGFGGAIPSDAMFGEHGAHADHGAERHDHHAHGEAPAGVMFDHLLAAGDVMVGYRYMYAGQDGGMLRGTDSVSDGAVKAVGCAGQFCPIRPADMNMHMHMLEFMYAPTDWLTLMVMPQYVDMDMNMRGLLVLDDFIDHPDIDTTTYFHHTAHAHATGGVGDTGLYALVRVAQGPNYEAHLGLGLSAPTGDVGIRLRDTHQVETGFIHYGMQLGSGTWDFKPSFTMTGQDERWSWGAQANATIRLEDRNASGYALGDVYQATAWGGYRFNAWLAGTVRGVYTSESAIDGAFNGTFRPIGTTDYTGNYGGDFADIGIGLSMTIPGETLRGNRLAVEWLQPVLSDVNGYQLERSGALSASWSLAF